MKFSARILAVFAAALVFAPGIASASVGANFAVLPSASTTDNLIGGGNVTWKFNVTTTADLANNDVVRFRVPASFGGQPFTISSLSVTASSGIKLYTDLGGQVLSNKVSNPSFESGLVGWYLSFQGAATSSMTTSAAWHGTKSLLLTAGANTNYVVATQTIAVSTNTSYSYSLKSQGVGTTTPLRVVIQANSSTCVSPNIVAFKRSAPQSWDCVDSSQPSFTASTSPYVWTNYFSTTAYQFGGIADSFTTPPYATSTTIWLMAGGDSIYASQSVLVDAVQFEQGASTQFNVGGVTAAYAGVSSTIISGGGNQYAFYGFVSGTVLNGTAFSVTASGFNNGSGQLSSVQNLTWTAEGGTLTSNSQPGGTFSSAKFSLNNTEGLIRAGGALVSDSNSSITPSSYATSTAATYTFKIKALSSIPSGGKIGINIPSEFSLAGVTVNLSQSINATGTTFASFSTTTAQGTNRITLVTAGPATIAGDVLTIVIGGFTNPATAAVYRPFSVFTMKANGGLLDGSFFGFEPNDYGSGSPPPVDTIHIGGTNNINIVVYKQTGSVNSLLTGADLTQVKIGIGCPDKGFYAGEKWLNASATAIYNNLLDCNYMVGAQPFNGGTNSFYDSFLPPAFKSINALGGQTVTSSMIFGVPDATAVFAVTGGVPGQQAFIHAFSPNFESFTPVFTDNTYLTKGFSATGTGFVKLRVKSGDNWNFNVESGSYGSISNFSSGTVKYWPPSIPSAYIGSSGTTTLSDVAYVQANNILNVTLSKTGGGGSVNDACVGVKRSGGGMFMGAQDTVCAPNNGSDYQFKVPSGTITVVLMRPGSGKPEEYPVGITSSVVNKTITLSAPTTYISVTVQDGSGRAINGAPIFAHGSNGFSQSMTGSGGTTTLYLAPGTYQVEGFAPALGQLTTQSVTLATTASVTFTVDTGNFKTISGQVTVGGVGESGVKIGAYGVNGTTGGNGAETDANGNYQLYVPAGTYMVGGWSDDTGGLSPQQVNVTSGNAAGVNFAVATQGTLHVTVQNAINVSQLFAGAFDQTSGRGNGTNSWSASGNSKIADIKLPAGTYVFHLGSPMIGEIANENVTITGGGTTNKTYNIAASTTLVTISGTVTTTGNVGVANVQVWASRIGGPGFYSAMTNGSGAYSLTVPDALTYLVGAKMIGYVTNGGDIQLAVSGNMTQNFGMLAAGSTITGQITGTNSAVVANAWVRAKKVIGANEVWTGGPTDASGNYSLNVDSGTWVVYAEGPCYQRSAGLSATAGTSGNNISLTAMSGCTVPTPQINGVTAASGGQVAKTGIILDIPANALGTAQSTVSVAVVTSSVVVATSNATPLKKSAQTITATDSSGQSITSLNSNVNLTLNYDSSELPHGFNESSLQLGYFDTNSGQWEPVAATVDTVNHKISAAISHFTDYGPILPGVPDAPTGFTATAASASSINLSWTASPHADYYIIYRSLTNSNFTTSIATTTATSYSNTGLSAATAYYYKVAGYNSNGEGLNSDSTSATTNAASVVGGGGGGGGGGGAAAPAVDVTPPYDTSIVINGGAEITTSTSVILTLRATDVTQMAISNNADLRDAPYETFTYTKNWTLSPGYGMKTVYVRYVDLVGNMAPVVKTTIVYAATVDAGKQMLANASIQTISSAVVTNPTSSLRLENLPNATVKAGSKISYTYRYTNSGNKILKLKVSRQILTNAKRPRAIFATAGNVTLKAGKSFSKKVTEQLPKSLTPGVYTVKIKVTSGKKVLEENSFQIKVEKPAPVVKKTGKKK